MKKTMTLDEFDDMVLKPALDGLMRKVSADMEAVRRFKAGLAHDDGAAQPLTRIEFKR